MLITSMRFRIIPRTNHRPLVLAYLTITFDNCLAVHDAKIIKTEWSVFLSMPDRELRDHCPGCRHRASLLARYCEMCATKLPLPDKLKYLDPDTGRPRYHTDVTHPIDPDFRRYCEQTVMLAYQAVVRERFERAEVFVKLDGTLRVVEIESNYALSNNQTAHAS